MWKRYIKDPLLLVLAAVFLFSSGCGTTKSVLNSLKPKEVAKKILPGKECLKKRLMVFPFVDYAGYGPERTARVENLFMDFMKRSPNILIAKPGKRAPQSPQKTPGRFGIFLDPYQIQLAREEGMNALLIGTLSPVEIKTEKKGIWPFRKQRTTFEVSLVISLVDVRRGTIIFTQSESEIESFSTVDAQMMEEQAIFEHILKTSIKNISKRQASDALERLEDEPWMGTVLDFTGNSLKINAGSRLGAKVGDRFEVFAPGHCVSSQDGRLLNLVGRKIGEIEINSLTDENSLATPLGEGPFEKGQTIRFMP